MRFEKMLLTNPGKGGTAKRALLVVLLLVASTFALNESPTGAVAVPQANGRIGWIIDPPEFNPARVRCGMFPGTQARCLRVAEKFFDEEFLPQYELVLANDPAAFEPVVTDTILLVSDGQQGVGPAGFGSLIAELFGTTSFEVEAVSDSYWFMPVTGKSIILFGDPTFTITDLADNNTTKTKNLVVSELYRRTDQTPRGWEIVFAQNDYKVPLSGLP